MTKYEPEPGTALVRLIPKYGGIPVPEKTSNIVSYDSLQSGEILAIHDKDKDEKGYLVGRVGHWRQFKDDMRLPENYALIELKDILGTTVSE